jgi:hypothetical protein
MSIVSFGTTLCRARKTREYLVIYPSFTERGTQCTLQEETKPIILHVTFSMYPLFYREWISQ